MAFAGRFERVEILDYKVGGGKVVDLTERLEQKRFATVLTVNLTKPVNIRVGYAFNEKMFVILLTLICAAAYKLLGYLSDLAAKEGRSRTDIVFVALFFTLLFVPMLYIDDKESSEEESRRLATVPDLLADAASIKISAVSLTVGSVIISSAARRSSACTIIRCTGLIR